MFFLCFPHFFLILPQICNQQMKPQSDFEQLFRRHYGELFAFARRFLPREADCEDALSAAFEDAWANFHDIAPEAQRAFLYKTVRNKCIDHLRRDATRRRHAELYALLTEGYEQASQLAELMEREQIVRSVVDALPDYTRQIFTACYVDRKQYRQVADEMGISPNTVKKYVSQALHIIAEQRKKRNNSKRT